MASNTLMGPWEGYRKVGLGVAAAVGVFLFVVAYVPLGFVALGLLIAASHVWKPLGMTNPYLGTYTFNTRPYAIATFFMAYKNNLRVVLTPLVALGLGPPTPDPDHGLEPGYRPFARLSGYWSLLASLVLASSEFLTAPLHYAFWGDFGVPRVVMFALSLVGFHAAIQTAVATTRIQGATGEVQAREPRPATMVTKVFADLPLRDLLIRSGTYGAVPTVLIVIAWLVAGWPWWVTALAAPVSLLLTAAVSGSRMMSAAYVAGWEARKERADFWNGAWSFMRDRVPVFVNEADLPTLADHERDYAKDPDPPPYVPLLRVAAFVFPPSSVFEDYVGFEERIRGQLNVERCAIAPIGDFDLNVNAEQTGTVGATGFRVWWTEGPLPRLLDPSSHPWLREFVVRAVVIPALASVRGIGQCVFVSCGMVTRAESECHLLEVKVVPPSGVSVTSFLERIEQVQTLLDVPWVRAARETKGGRGTANVVTLFIGDFPAAEKTKFINPSTQVRKQIDRMEWAYVFSVRRLTGVTGPPEYVDRRPTTKIVDKIVFRLPDGLPFEEIVRQISSLKTTSGNQFMEIEQGADENKRMSAAERVRAESRTSSLFTVIASKIDPLNRIFDFGSYKSQVLTGREPGVAKIEWSPGVMADDSLARYSFPDGGEEPHLLVAGSSGSGKAKSLDTPVLTPFGTRPLGDLVEGDVVFDAAGHPTTVVHAFDAYTPDSAYRVTFSDGTSTVASGDHPWSVTEAAERRDVSANLRGELDRAVRAEDAAAVVARLRALGDAASAFDVASVPGAVPGEAYVRDVESGFESPTFHRAGRWEEEAAVVSATHYADPEPSAAVLAVPPELWGLVLAAPQRSTRIGSVLAVRSAETTGALVKSLGYEWTSSPGTRSVEFLTVGSGLGRLASLLTEAYDREALTDLVLDAYADRLDAVLLGALTAGGDSSASGRLLVSRNALPLIERLAATLGHAVELSKEDLGQQTARRMTWVSVVGFDPSSVAPSPVPDALSYYAGLRVALEHDGLPYHLNTADPGVGVELLARGLRTTAVRVSSGRARVYVRGLKGVDAARPYLDSWLPSAVLETRESAWTYLAGWARALGYVGVNGRVLLYAREDRLGPATAAVLLDRAGVRGDVSVREGFTVVASPDLGDLPLAPTTLALLADRARHEVRLDSRGRRVLSIPEIEELTGVGRVVFEGLIKADGVLPTASWRSPTIQESRTGTVLKASRSTPLYPVHDVVRHLANALERRAPAERPLTVEGVVLTTEELAAGLYASPTGARNYAIPVHPVTYPDQDRSLLTVDPYTLGAWLGDGFSASGEVCGADDEVFEGIAEAGYEETIRTTSVTTDGRTFRVSRFRHLASGLTLGEQLGELGLTGPGWGGRKRIPWVYQTASFEDRLSLLQGLMDTDGYSNGGFSLSKADLFEDFVLLARGLGIVVHTRVKVMATEEHPTYRDAHVASFTTTLDLHRIERKRLSRPEVATERAERLVYVRSVERLPDAEVPVMRCISVDSPSRTFRAGPGLTATHNSVVINSMILQLAYNNLPSELRLWMIEPKNEMQVYRDMDVVERFVDSFSPGLFMSNAADLMEEAVAEMNRRYKVMQDHPKQPKKLDKARQIAKRESEAAGTPIEDHPLYMPFVVIILEECATLFAEANDKEEKAEQARLLRQTTEMARKSRAAGMYLVAATQYPTNASIPMTIRAQMARIGLKCQNVLASQVVIGETGLEQIKVKGVGKLTSKGAYRQFRGFWVQDGDLDDGEANDVLEIIAELPTREGGVQGAAGVVYQRVEVPDPSEMVFRVWDSSAAASRVRKDVGAEEVL